jgi:hypothetical protein
MPGDPTVALNAALVAALNDMPSITRNNDVNTGTYSYKFADLATVMAQVKPILKANGLAFMQNVVPLEGGKIGVLTDIVHTEGGERSFGPLPMSAGGNAQALGSGITYAKRYALMAALGIATEDDDGAAHKEAPQAVPELRNSPAATALFDRVTFALADPELKAHLITFGKENGRKPFTAEGFDADRRWMKQVTDLLDGWDKADRVDAARDAGML